MKVIFAGKFEEALLDSIATAAQPGDEPVVAPSYFNRSEPNYFERCGTFVALADLVVVPDFRFRDNRTDEREPSVFDGLNIADIGDLGPLSDEEAQQFATRILNEQVLSSSSFDYITYFPFRPYPIAEDRRPTGEHYLSRLFCQLSAGSILNGYVIVSEDDLQVIQEIGAWALTNNVKAPFEFPNLREMFIEPNSFSSGLLNFCPPDLRSLAAVRSDSQIQEYASVVRSILAQTSAADREGQLLAALIDAHEKKKAGERVEKLFEATRWIVKPLHYLPGVDAAVTIAEDIADVGMKPLKKKLASREWYLMAAKMADIAITDYLNRKDNQRTSGSLVQPT